MAGEEVSSGNLLEKRRKREADAAFLRVRQRSSCGKLISLARKAKRRQRGEEQASAADIFSIFAIELSNTLPSKPLLAVCTGFVLTCIASHSYLLMCTSARKFGTNVTCFILHCVLFASSIAEIAGIIFLKLNL